jgi:anti-sigma-K factor RskA
MTEHDDLDMQIAEFVLGTLPADQRKALQARRELDPALDAQILQWEERLVGMTDTVAPVQPGPELFAQIERVLDQQAAQPAQSNKTASVVTLRRQVNRWRWSTAVASAAALVLVTVLTFQPAGTPESFVAVFQHDDQQPAFLLTVDLQNRQLNIRPVTAEPQPGKSYQLWIKSDELGPNPRSVGVLGDQMQVDQGALKQYDPALLRGATFGISLEPAGGSPTGQPTSPAIHGYLYPAGDDRNRRI